MNDTLAHQTVIDARHEDVQAVLFDNERDPIPKPWCGPLGHLVGAVHEVRETKAGTRSFSLATYKHGARRGNPGVESQTALVFDLDHVTDGHLSAAWTWLTALAGVMYTSFSDRLASAADRCARIIVLLTRPVTPAEAKILHAVLTQQLAVPTDEHTTDPARIWYAPACPPATASGAFIAYTSGARLDPASLLAQNLEPAPAPAAGQAIPASDWRELVMTGATPGGRHASILKLAAHLIGKNVDPLVALHLVLAWNRVKNSPPKPDDEVIEAVNYVAGRELSRREGRHDR
jgi:hypothetical protein